MADRYAAFNNASARTLDKVSCEDLPVAVPHLVVKISETTHEKFGGGLKAVFRDAKKVPKFTYLPPRIAKRITSSHVQGYKEDIDNKKPPLLVYFGKIGQSFDVRLLAFTKELAKSALKGETIAKPPSEEDSEQEVNMSWLDSLAD